MPNVAEIRALMQWYVAMGVDESIAEIAPDRMVAPTALGHPNKAIELQEVITLKPAPLIAPEPSASLASVIAQARAIADSATTLDELRQAIAGFEGCSLKKMAKNTVFGDGNPASKIMLIGGAPDSDDDQSGTPFSGAAGQLLDEMLGFIGLKRTENAYFTNCVFWRPPGNQAPSSEDIEICRPLVEKHISLINPEWLILMGAPAAGALLGDTRNANLLRNKELTYKNQYIDKVIHTRVIFHPSQILRQPLQKKLAWFDLLAIQNDIDSQGK